METNKKRAIILAASILATFLFMRTVLYFLPNADLYVAGYEVHHLFVGILLMAASGIPLIILRQGDERWLDVSALAFGIGLSLALDEFVLLIATAGSNTDYYLPISLNGALVMVGLALAYILIIKSLTANR